MLDIFITTLIGQMNKGGKLESIPAIVFLLMILIFFITLTIALSEEKYQGGIKFILTI